ncbi:MAG: dinitrogenase iron-molybdenum cofactor biosynthesis protein [Oligosphaeraceae bacterium]|nr:dinitrogenase iron-molybdenum cofactor biosynthesis protein [Oligosphaeraceae bacterium]
MKVALTSQGDSLDTAVDTRFGRAAKFLLWDSETGAVTAVDNKQNLNAAQGAGIQSAMRVVEQGADVVITGHCGPKAFRVLSEAGVKIYLTKAGTGHEVIRLFQEGKLEIAANADVEGHWV